MNLNLLKPSDPSFDNGKVLSELLAAPKTIAAPALPPLDYYLSTPIEIMGLGSELRGGGGYCQCIFAKEVGVTRLIWNGPPDGDMLVISGSGGRLSQLTFMGGIKKTGPRAHCGIKVLSTNKPYPSGRFIFDQCAFGNLEYGVRCMNEPVEDGWATHLTLRSPIFHGVRYPFWVDNAESVQHRLSSAQFLSGCETAVTFLQGGGLTMDDCYIGDLKDGTLLYLGRANSGNGRFDITGLQVDGSAERLRMVNHGKYTGRVRIEGSYSSASLKRHGRAEPLVLERDGVSKYADVEIDCTNGVRWPREE